MKRQSAFTLIEVMVAMGIVFALVGIVFAAIAPARESARVTVCSSNLHQIGMAYAVYAADYSGLEPTIGVRSHYYELGLPRDEDLDFFKKNYVKNNQVFFCPSYHGKDSLTYRATSYMGYSVDGEGWADLVAKRGPDLPLWRCDWHNPGSDYKTDYQFAPRWATKQFNILRLGGQVKMVHISAQDYHTWDW